jgi:CelD/BcsL family acetyltransferase involved in cellulose biosynthesis
VVTRHIESVAGRAVVPAWWGPLYDASCNRSIFLSEAWIQNWLDIYGADFEVHWIHWTRGEEVVGGCLLLQRAIAVRFVKLRTLYVNATGEARVRTPLAEFNDILHLRGFEEEIAADFAQIVRSMSWSRLMLSGYLDQSLLRRCIPELPACRIEREVRVAPFVDLIAVQDEPFEASLSGNARYQIRRTNRLYEQRFGAVTISRADETEQAQRSLGELAALHNARWKGRGIKGSFENTGVVEFHRRMIAQLVPRGTLDLMVARAGERAIGYLYNFIDRGKVYFFQSGFVAEDDSKVKPGLLTHAMAIEYYRRGGLREYDFLAGDAQYKRSLAKQHRELCWTTVYRDKLSIRALLWLRNAVRTALKG